MEFQRGMIVRIKSRTPLEMNRNFQAGKEFLVYAPEEEYISWIGPIMITLFEIFTTPPAPDMFFRYNTFGVDRVMNRDIEFVRWFEHHEITNATAEKFLPDFEEDVVQ